MDPPSPSGLPEGAGGGVDTCVLLVAVIAAIAAMINHSVELIGDTGPVQNIVSVFKI